MSGMPCALAQQRLSSAPVCVLQVFQVIREGLLDVERAGEDLGLVAQQLVHDLVHIRGLFDRAVEVRTQPADAIGKANATHALHALEVPGRIGAAQLHLEALQAIALNPVGEQHGVAVVRLAAVAILILQRIHTAHEVPHGQGLRRVGDEVVLRILAREGHCFRIDERAEVAVHEVGVVGRIRVALVRAAKGIMHRDVEGAEHDERTEVRHRVAAEFRVQRVERGQQMLVLEVMRQLHRMALLAEGREQLRRA